MGVITDGVESELEIGARKVLCSVMLRMIVVESSEKQYIKYSFLIIALGAGLPGV